MNQQKDGVKEELIVMWQILLMSARLDDQFNISLSTALFICYFVKQTGITYSKCDRISNNKSDGTKWEWEEIK